MLMSTIAFAWPQHQFWFTDWKKKKWKILRKQENTSTMFYSLLFIPPLWCKQNFLSRELSKCSKALKMFSTLHTMLEKKDKMLCYFSTRSEV